MRKIRPAIPWLGVLASGLACLGLLPGNAVAFGANASAGPDAEIASTVYGINSGLPLPTESVLQTRDGYLWVGTQAGLARFDGIRFKLFRSGDTVGLASSVIRVLLEDRDGALWIGTDNGLSRYRDGSFAKIGPATLSIRSLAQDRTGTIWVGTTDGLLRFAAGELQPPETDPLVQSATISRIFPDAEGRVWICRGRKKPVVWKDGKFSTFSLPGASPEHVLAVAQTSDRVLWFADAEQGLFRVEGRKTTRIGADKGLANASLIRGLLTDANGGVWIYGRGIYRVLPGDRDHAQLVGAYQFAVANSMCQDQEGSFWLATEGDGLCRLTFIGAKAFREAELGGLPRSVTEDSSGNIWVAPSGAKLVVMRRDGAVDSVDSSDESFCVCAMSDGSVWSGGGTRLQIFKDGRLVEHPEYPRVRAIFQDRRGDIWLAPEKIGTMRFHNGQFALLGGRNGVPQGEPLVFADDPSGTVFIGFRAQGLCFYQDGCGILMDSHSGLPNDNVRALYSDADGNLWMGSKGRGLAVRIDGRWFNPQAWSDPFLDQVSAIVEDSSGTLFLGSRRGVLYAKRAELLAMARGGASVTLHSVLPDNDVRSDAVASSVQPVAWSDKGGSIWFAQEQGLYRIDPTRLDTRTVPPSVFIEGISFDGMPARHAIGTIPRIPAEVARLQVDFTSPGFLRPHDRIFRYRMLGHDRGWIDAGRERSAFYTDLPPGAYRFQVQACSEDGVWSRQTAELALVKTPYFYQTSWFRILVAIAGVAALGGILRFRTEFIRRRERHLQIQNEILERRIAEHTAELRQSYEALRKSEYFFHSLVESLPNYILRKDTDRKVTYANTAYTQFVGRSIEQLIGTTVFDLYPPDLASNLDEVDRKVLSTGEAFEFDSERVQGERKRHLHVKETPLRDEGGKVIGVQLIIWDVSRFRDTEDKLRSANRDLIEASRLAGMAELATGILHDIGNALTSVNISSAMALERLNSLKVSSLAKIAELLFANRENLSQFLASDPRGRNTPDFLVTLARHFEEEREAAVRELGLVLRSVDHMNAIVAEQQNQAKASGSAEILAASDLVEYALALTEGALRRNQVLVVRNFSPTPPVNVPRQRVLQILANLIRNAKDATLCHEPGKRAITLTVRMAASGNVAITVEDNGVGMTQEQLERVFTFGFTTKASGHGFGLHSSALAASDLGGTITAASAGPGKGATFTLEIPPHGDEGGASQTPRESV